VAELTKTVDGKPLPASQFAYVGDGKDISTWHLPIDKDHIASALKMYGHEKQVPPAFKAGVVRKIIAAAKAAGLDTKDFEEKYLKSSEHADFGNGWVEIFRAGNYGPKGIFSADDLDRIVQNYDPATHEAPACVGHPKDDLPAYGWADRLMRQGDTLLAKFKEVDPAFEDAVQAGRYKKRSAAFYLDDAGRIENLRHVAFLGAQPPEVKGLKNLQFDDNGREFTAVDFGEENGMSVDEKSVKDQIKAFFAEMFAPQQQAVAFTEADVKRIASEAAQSATTALQAKVSELQAQLSTQTAKFSERETAIATGEVRQRAIDAVNKLKSQGRWIPAFEKMGISLVFAELAKDSETLEFGEGESKRQATALEILAEFMESLPRIVPEGRTFTAPATRRTKGSSGDPLTDAAKARQKEKNITFAEALAQIASEEPELTVLGAASGGQV
jgi:hypothetical protein